MPQVMYNSTDARASAPPPADDAGAAAPAQRGGFLGTLGGLTTMRNMEQGEAASIGRAAMSDARARDGAAGGAEASARDKATPRALAIDYALRRAPMLYLVFMNVGLFVAFLAVESPHKAWGDVDLLGDASSYPSNLKWCRRVYDVCHFIGMVRAASPSTHLPASRSGTPSC